MCETSIWHLGETSKGFLRVTGVWRGNCTHPRNSQVLKEIQIPLFLNFFKKINIDGIIITGDDKKGIAEMIGFLQISL